MARHRLPRCVFNLFDAAAAAADDDEITLRANSRKIFDLARHSGWCLQMLRNGQPRFENLTDFDISTDPQASIAAKVGQSLDSSFDWDTLHRMRKRWPGQFMVKGVSRGGDAERLASLGVDAIWVSNHGGRQHDTAVASMDALPEVAAALGDRVPVLLDSDVRPGTDVVKALAEGAQDVAIGRAPLYGAAAAGEGCAERVLQIVTEKMRRAMQLCGTPHIFDIRLDLLS